jgi:hypothetical protein
MRARAQRTCAQTTSEDGARDTDPIPGAASNRTAHPNSVLIARLCALNPGGESEDADRLLKIIRVQTVTRGRAKTATRGEMPLSDKTVDSLLGLVKETQNEDLLCQRISREVTEDATRPEGQRRKDFTVVDGVLYRDGKLYVPQQRALITELMQLYHDDQFAGHWGIDKTLELLRRKFYWEDMAADVREYILACPQCQGTAIPNHKPYGKLNPLPIPRRPWQQVSLDWII